MKPVLVIMAAGMGSRFGGLKQMEPVDPQGHILMDYSIYDAMKAGFGKVVFVIRKENEQLFREKVGDRIADRMEAEYAFQELEDIPRGFDVPEGRVKPWGTGHAVLAARHLVDGPFAVINADDYYGKSAFSLICDYLKTHEDDEKYRYAMVGYILKNTLTENGSVSRGVCVTDSDQYLTDITERTKIIQTQQGAAFSEDDGKTWNDLSADATVSMNMWGFSLSFMKELEGLFGIFLEENLRKNPSNPQKCEFYLPFAVHDLLIAGKATAKVLKTSDKWYGMTYREDRQQVIDSLAAMKKQGLYPEDF